MQFVSGGDLRFVFGRHIADFVCDVDCGTLYVDRARRLGLTESTYDDKIYGKCPEDPAWVIGKVWISIGANGEKAGRFYANAEQAPESHIIDP